MVVMVSLSMLFSSPLIQNHPKTLRPICSKPSNSNSVLNYSPSVNKIPSLHQSHYSNPLPDHSLLFQNSSILYTLSKACLSLTTFQLLQPLPGLASEIVGSSTDQAANKIDLESILVSIDDFFNRNPFFVASCTFIWLVAIPLTQEYFSKCKSIAAIDAFRKLRDDPNAQLLDIRNRNTMVSLRSPNLKILSKSTFQIEFNEDDEDGFVKKVLQNLPDPKNTVICILDNFDGNSMRVAKLLFNNGFKEAYAIRGGVRGKKGWLAIQETLLPPSVHIYPKKKVKKISQLEKNEDKEEISSSEGVSADDGQRTDNGHVKVSNTASQIELGSRSLSPYPNYPDLKPPSSPTPSKP
ncbi:rhodanese-like domain-containing protein 4A chloroplastic [Tripterygium wilfordii]|uniref:Rhodanese-like domain-containing protein 4A chloroplastic n=1 Tax=Tripterygium wilfordii TaxID=458696 RepID=A0A7J7DIV1_TRIWF|nr:rhodanese-like domain-containing protein 4A, chloroplastic [Tripterygium wilfordii]KAF5746243.1 rhodanese-like domain-containing protein 4A chloroplastic [Tripterygium wilfordii]